MRSIKELLIILRELMFYATESPKQSRFSGPYGYYTGLCVLISSLHDRSVITNDEADRVLKHIKDNRPEGSPLNAYFFIIPQQNFYEAKRARIEFLDKLITNL